MGLLTRYPALKRALANQYQAILAAGAVGFAALLASPLPLLLFAGVELMAMPFLVDRVRRRLEIEKKYADRRAVEMTQEQQYAALPANLKARFGHFRELVARVQSNYRGLSAASQDILAEQTAKFEVILASCLKRLWLLEKYDEIRGSVSPGRLAEEVEDLVRALENEALDPRVRDALEKNLEIKRELARTAEKNSANRAALEAELDSLDSLLRLLLQKSIAATDATAFTLEIDDVLAQVQADAASVEEMERMIGSIPDLESRPRFSSQFEAPPPPPPAARARTGRR